MKMEQTNRAARAERSERSRFGICPECGESGQRKDVGSHRLGYCTRHGLRWYVGENPETFISSAQGEDEDDWLIKNDVFLKRFRGTTTYQTGPTLIEWIVWRLRKWRRRFAKGPVVEARINVMSTDDVCHVCGCGSKHPLGVTETYIAGTDRWVCPTCAFGIDSELAIYVRRFLLEARVNLMSGYYACHLCGTGQEHITEATQTYLVGTELWVCRDCAIRIDSQLARFAYEPGFPGKRKRRFREKERHFGICPECGECPSWMNVGRTHWAYCERHGLKLCVGQNIFSSWRDENEDDWTRNALFLARLRKTDPYFHDGPPLLERIGRMLIKLSGVSFWGFLRRLRTAALSKLGIEQGYAEASNEDDVPF
jgi:hypothetical protein